MKVLEPILNIVLYIPEVMNSGAMYEPREYRERLYEARCRDEVGEYINNPNDYAYACIAVLDNIGVPYDLIRSTLEDNLLKINLTNLYKYLALSRHMILSITERINLFALIKRFHERGLTTDPRFPGMQDAIVYSLFRLEACLKPEFAIAQPGYYSTPVNFSAWINVVYCIRLKYPGAVGALSEQLPSAAKIIDMFTDDGQIGVIPQYPREELYVDNPIMLDILIGLMSGAGITMPPSDYNHEVAVRIAMSRFELLRASFKKLIFMGQNHPQFTPNFKILFKLIVANHFETIPNDVDHPIVFMRPRVPGDLQSYDDFLANDEVQLYPFHP